MAVQWAWVWAGIGFAIGGLFAVAMIDLALFGPPWNRRKTYK